MMLDIATAPSSESKTWKNKKIGWDALASQLSKTTYTRETLAEYLAMPKQEQGRIKDVGGFVGGYLIGGRRKPETVGHRQLLTLDLDFALSDFFADFCVDFSCAAVCHGTHKHSQASPRLRLIIPLDRPCQADEYEAVARWVAGQCGIKYFDKTTFQPSRLMYWPSTPAGETYYFEQQEGEPLRADWVLSQYADWSDRSLWPCSEYELKEVRGEAKKQANPLDKEGLVGAFCRAYSIEDCIDAFLQGVYSTVQNERSTFLNGTTANGIVVYDSVFSYSHHGTDPAGGKLLNAWDLVRVHKFGNLDKEGEKASQKAMEGFASGLDTVKKQIADERLSEAQRAFEEPAKQAGKAAPEKAEPQDNSWALGLAVDKKGNYEPTYKNLELIFDNDPNLKGVFAYNLFESQPVITRLLPWQARIEQKPGRRRGKGKWEHALIGCEAYIEEVYGISCPRKIESALFLSCERNSFHPVLDYLDGLKWDGVNRLDTALIDFLGCDDNIYTREMSRVFFSAMCGRVINPGCKYDLMLVLVGAQGTGKSKFAKYAGIDWASDSFSFDLKSKEQFEQLQGQWVVEAAELTGMKKAEVEHVKQFISKLSDKYRPAFGRVLEDKPRQCVMIGTTNTDAFLQDKTGNRRFAPVKMNPERAKYKIDDLPSHIGQILAEAVEAYNGGQKLYLSHEAEAIARKVQGEHTESDSREGVISDYLNATLPADWDTRSIYERRAYLGDCFAPDGEQRKTVCAAEVWCECLGKDKADMDRYKTRDINEMLRSLGWKPANTTKTYKNYGTQKYYVRV